LIDTSSDWQGVELEGMGSGRYSGEV